MSLTNFQVCNKDVESDYVTFLEEAPVWFVGAGPGDPDLITVKGKKLICNADTIIYSGSLVPVEVIACCKQGAKVIDSAPLTLEETHALAIDSVNAGKLVARVHTGDSCLYGAMREQKNLLDEEGVKSRVIPGVSAAFAAAAAAETSFTVPETVQSLTITRMDGRTPVPALQSVKEYSRHGGALAIYLSSQMPEQIASELRNGGVEESTPILIAYRVGWPEQSLIWATLATLVEKVQEHKIKRQAVFLVLPGEKDGKGAVSRLYAKEFEHGFRKGTQ